MAAGDNGVHCTSERHKEFEKRLDDRWKESWDLQHKINDALFKKFDSINIKLWMILGGLVAINAIALIGASFVSGHIKH